MDLGCGEEGYLTYLLGKAGEIIGLDDRTLQGPYSRYLQADLNRALPLEPESVDLAASKFLLEHLEDPARFLRAVGSALRPGGQFVMMTANILYYPYAVNFLLARLLPQDMRMRIVEWFSGRPPHDIFPVRYRCNTPRSIRSALEEAGFEILHLGTYSDCQVSAVARPLGALAVAYEKVVSSLGLEWARGFIVAAARRK
jgi:SAM-dependent methyltransferase